MVVTHQNHVNLVVVRLSDIENLIEWILTKRERLLAVNIGEVDDLSYALDRLDEASSAHLVVLHLRIVDTDYLLVLPVIQRVQVRQLLYQIDVLVFRRLLQVVWVHQVHMVTLVYEILLVYTDPFVVLRKVVQRDLVNV